MDVDDDAEVDVAVVVELDVVIEVDVELDDVDVVQVLHIIGQLPRSSSDSGLFRRKHKPCSEGLHRGGSAAPLHRLEVVELVEVVVVVLTDEDVADDVLVLLVVVGHARHSTGHCSTTMAEPATDNAVLALQCVASNIWHSGGSRLPSHVGCVVEEDVDVVVENGVHESHITGQSERITSPIGLLSTHNGRRAGVHFNPSRSPLHAAVVVELVVVAVLEELEVDVVVHAKSSARTCSANWRQAAELTPATSPLDAKRDSITRSASHPML